MDFAKLILTALSSVLALFVITKLMGHKQVAQLDFFDYVCGITIGSIGAELATDLESPWKSLTALVLYGTVSILLSLMTHKMPKTRKYINGTPTIIMQDGKLYRKNMKKSKLDLSEFLLLCREQGYFELSQIGTAVFEHNGKLSVLPTGFNIGTELVMDGRIMGENLIRLGKDVPWLKAKLKEQGFKSEKQVFLGIYYKGKDNLSLFKYC
ncbi:MAG: DUF421 domain-containing protein [Clostridia bacterium]|nr:DUF421 domain-containing protein [Clostridia bacterium]